MSNHSSANGQRIGLHEGSIDLPAGFEDRSTNIFVPANTQHQPNLSIARDWLQEGESLEDYVTRQAAILKARLAGHKLLNRTHERLGAGAAPLIGERIEAQYKNGAQIVRQRQAAFVVAPGRALILTAATPRAFDDAFELLWRAWLDSFVAAPEASADPVPA